MKTGRVLCARPSAQFKNTVCSVVVRARIQTSHQWPRRVRLRFEARSRDGTPWYFLVTFRRQTFHLYCGGGRSIFERRLHSSVKESKTVLRQANLGVNLSVSVRPQL